MVEQNLAPSPYHTLTLLLPTGGVEYLRHLFHTHPGHCRRILAEGKEGEQEGRDGGGMEGTRAEQED